MPWIEAASGKRFHYTERGRGEPLLLVSGWGGDARSWAADLDFYGATRRCLTIEHPGLAGDPVPEGLFGPADMARRQADALEALGITRADVLGFSLGGAVAQELAMERPDMVRRLVLSGTFVRLDDRAAHDLGLLADLMAGCDRRAALRMIYRLVFGPDFLFRNLKALDSLIEQSLVDDPIPLPVFAYQAKACLAHDARGRLGRIAAPTVVTHGLDDALVAPRHAAELAQAIPYARLVEFPGLGHCHLWEDPAAFRAAVLAFLDSP